MELFSITPIVIAAPVFVILVVIERLAAHVKKRNIASFQDSITSINVGLLSQFVKSTGAVISIFMYIKIEEKVGAFEWDAGSALTWIFALILYDFCYYWVHRAGHEVNLFWASHITHHSSEEFNLSTAMRSSSTAFYFKWIFFVPLALLGIPLQVFLVVALVDSAYQFWVHTQLVNRLGLAEKFLVTPSIHRVHHGQNDYCIDKNYGGIFSVWDQMFGTFAIEKVDEPVVFGVRTPLNSWNPVWGNLHHYVQIVRKIRQQNHWRDRWMCLMGGPTWHAKDVRPKIAESPVVENYKKFSTDTSFGVRLTGVLSTALTLVLLMLYLGARAEMSSYIQIMWVGLAIAYMAALGAFWSADRRQKIADL
tara:strand:+ start:396 stop:1487 length:1092 start_codon:yes stop_codon:yes gene_type:complete